MDKITFLEELRKSLRVLKDEEIQDIISEYEQHIDLKVEKGLTVEQAIADFGNVKELAAEILEGYHVKAEFWNSDEETDSKSEQCLAEHTIRKITINKVWSWMRAVARWFINGFVWCGKEIIRPFIWMKSKLQRNGRYEETVASKEITNRLKGWFVHKMKGFGTMMLRLWDWLVRICLWCMRIGWNFCVAGTALAIGGFGLMCLFAVGVLAVLLLQGYPFIGVTIGCLGLAVCMFSATVFVWTLIWHSSKLKEDKEEKIETGMMDLTEMEEGQHA